jgi:hypothetical protein
MVILLGMGGLGGGKKKNKDGMEMLEGKGGKSEPVSDVEGLAT